MGIVKGNILSDEELENVFGGKMTPEAEEWFKRNAESISHRMQQILGKNMDTVATFCTMLAAFFNNQTEIYDLQGAKAYLKSKGVDCDDLV